MDWFIPVVIVVLCMYCDDGGVLLSHNDWPTSMFRLAFYQLEQLDINDWNATHTDIPRLRQGQVGAQVSVNHHHHQHQRHGRSQQWPHILTVKIVSPVSLYNKLVSAVSHQKVAYIMRLSSRHLGRIRHWTTVSFFFIDSLLGVASLELLWAVAQIISFF